MPSALGLVILFPIYYNPYKPVIFQLQHFESMKGLAHNLFELSDDAAPVAVKAIDGPCSYCQLACQTLEITMRQVDKRKFSLHFVT